jgi:hypothetical protein
MIDQVRVEELVDVLEDAYDKYSQSKAITKDASTMMKDWAERNELDPKNVRAVYRNYASFRDGKLKWGDGEDDGFTDLLVQVMDQVTK